MCEPGYPVRYDRGARMAERLCDMEMVGGSIPLAVTSCRFVQWKDVWL